MKTLIFSDTHFGRKFEQKRYDALARLIKSTDRVIINGDFWDSLTVSWNAFLNSKWKLLFPILKSKNTIYLYGNHDHKELIDERINLFSNEAGEEYRINVGSKVFIITHGNKIAPSPDETNPSILLHKKLVKLSYSIYTKCLKIFGKGFLFLGENKNIKIMNWAKKNLAENEVLVTGHTHFSELDLSNKYINTGMIRYGYLEYLIIDGDDFRLVQEKY